MFSTIKRIFRKEYIDFEVLKTKPHFLNRFPTRKAFFPKKRVVDRFSPENPRTSTEFGDSAGDV